MPIRYVILDFDGTCTLVERIQKQFLADYHRAISPAFGELPEAEWKSALASVKRASPHVGWTFGGAPAAPAAADPYIQSGEAAALLQRRYAERDVHVSVPDAYHTAYHANAAPWREETRHVLETLVDRGIRVGFISNSATAGLTARLDSLLEDHAELRGQIHVQGNAAKFKVQELSFDPKGPAEKHRARFEAIPAAAKLKAAGGGLRRPAYLRRGRYFEAICAFWQFFGEKGFPAAETLVCGDVWELDLALPAALGIQTHLIERAKPYGTYPYELAQVPTRDVSEDLHGLIRHVERVNRR
jgi:FMN phosphatase YigB (HAD superfamily)